MVWKTSGWREGNDASEQVVRQLGGADHMARTRRDHAKLLTLIDSIALLHQPTPGLDRTLGPSAVGRTLRSHLRSQQRSAAAGTCAPETRLVSHQERRPPEIQTAVRFSVTTPSWPCTEMWSTELAHENRLACAGSCRVKQLSPRPLPVGRFCPDYRWLVLG
jgi:hypothetical protein